MTEIAISTTGSHPSRVVYTSWRAMRTMLQGVDYHDYSDLVAANTPASGDTPSDIAYFAELAADRAAHPNQYATEDAAIAAASYDEKKWMGNMSDADRAWIERQGVIIGGGRIAYSCPGWTLIHANALGAQAYDGGTCPHCTRYGPALVYKRQDDLWIIMSQERSIAAIEDCGVPPACHVCAIRKQTDDAFWMSALVAARQRLPKLYQWMTDTTVLPTTRIATPLPKQQQMLDAIQEGRLIGHTILYSGPTCTGKTVMASELLIQTCKAYFARGFPGEDYKDCSLPIWRINIPEWLDAQRSYLNRNFDDESMSKPPEPNAQTVAKLVKTTHTPYDDRYAFGGDVNAPTILTRTRYIPNDSKCPPVLFLEELDKFSPSKFTRDTLFTLMNAVFEAGGAVVSTTNMTPAELKLHLGEWLYRRVTESAVDGKSRIVDLYALIAAGRRKKKTA